MGNSIERGGTEAGSNSPKRPEKREDSSSAVEASADGAGSARAAQRHVRKPATCDVPPSPHRLKPSRKQRKRHMLSSLIKWKKFPKFDAGANDAKGTENYGSSLKEKLTSQLCRANRACLGSRFPRSESADEDGLNIQTAENREGSSVASH